MGNLTIILFRHDCLHEIENDPDFGKKIAKAIHEKQYSGERTVSISSGSCSNAADVIGSYFHTHDTRFVVFEGGTGWVANGQKKPDWSSVTFDQVKKIFGGTKSGH